MKTMGSRSSVQRAGLGLLMAVTALATFGGILTTAPAALPWLVAVVAIAAAYVAGYRRGSAGARRRAPGPAARSRGKARRWTGPSGARIARDVAGLLLRR